jgi:hypothetical protein
MKSLRFMLSTSVALLYLIFVMRSAAQGILPYPKAITDRLIHQETPMPPPPVNTPFADPDFGSMMVRATDETTNTIIPGSYLRNEASGQANMWSSDTSKFYVIGAGGYEFAFGFDGSSMKVTSLPEAGAGKGLLLPLRPGSTFSFVDPDLIYGTLNETRLTISSYRFSTGITSTVLDTTTCHTEPSLVPSNKVVSDDDVSLSARDKRVSISEGGPQSGKDPFVVVYDQSLGCRWYNTQTGQIGGQWGKVGTASVSATYLVRHAYLSRSGTYVRILTNDAVWYVWNLATLNVTACPIHGGPDCGGYGVGGYNSFVNALGVIDGMNIGKRSFGDLARITPLVWPLGLQPDFDQPKHFTWSNVNADDNVPVCVTGYNYEGYTEITEPYDDEIFCIETDGLKSTVWRFAHHRAIWMAPYFNTQPLGNVSDNGRFFLFTSGWDGQLGWDSQGVPRSDVWIVKLD